MSKKIALFVLVFSFCVLTSHSAFAADVDISLLKQISDKQDQILKKLDEISAELAIVKVRASLAAR